MMRNGGSAPLVFLIRRSARSSGGGSTRRASTCHRRCCNPILIAETSTLADETEALRARIALELDTVVVPDQAGGSEITKEIAKTEAEIAALAGAPPVAGWAALRV